MDIRIGSLNCLDLSQHSDFNKDISLIARIIIREKFDVIALQEVSKEGLGLVLTALNRTGGGQKWEGYSDNNDYAFVWNAKHMTLLKTRLPSGQIRVFYPHVYNRYKRDPELKKLSIKRPPFYGRFQTNHPGLPKVELRLINTHIRWSKGKDGKEFAPAVGKLDMRKFEFQALTRCIYYYVSDKVYGKPEGESNPLTAYTILLGDYNMNLRESGAGSPCLGNLERVTISCGRSDSRAKVIVTKQSELTTLKKQDESEEQNAQIFANNYDHFSYDKNRFSGTRKRISRVNTVEKYCHNDPLEHIKKISDHTPIKMSLNIKKE